MSQTIDKKVASVQRFFKNALPSVHPIIYHPVSACEEYVKNQYIDLLFVFAQYECQNTEEAFRFIERIMQGSKDTLSVTEHIRRSLTFDIAVLSEWINQLKQNGLSEMLMLDAMLISFSNGVPTKNKLTFLAQWCDMLDIDKNTLQKICRFAVSIAELDERKPSLLTKNCNENDPLLRKILPCYLDPFFDRVTIVNDRYIYLHSRTKQKWKDINEFFNRKSDTRIIDTLIIENVRFDSKNVFDNIGTVILRDCIFENVKDDLVLGFKEVGHVIIERCTFRNTDRVMFFHTADTDAEISDCLFENCHTAYRCGVIIESGNGNKIHFQRDVFRNIINYSCSNYVAVISSYNNISAEDCTFIDCTVPNRNNKSLFHSGTFKEKNNTYTNCCKLRS